MVNRPVLKVKEGVQKTFTATIKNASGVAVDLTAYDAVKFVMVDESTKAVKNDEASASFVSKANGTVSYTFTSGDVDTVGKYVAYFVFEESSVKTLSAPEQYFEIEVIESYV